MQAKLHTKRHYKTFDQSESIKQAQKLIERIKKKQQNLRSVRIDADTIIQIEINKSNFEEIVKRIKKRPRTICIIEQIEYGQYA